MIKVLLLNLSPADTWDTIARQQRSVIVVFLFYVLPLVALCGAGEAFALTQWGTSRGALGKTMEVPAQLAIVYGMARLSLNLALVFGGAKLLQTIAVSFHTRPTYSECFTCVGYSFGPQFVFQLVNGLPVLHTWICWGVGMILTIRLLYHGLPRLLKPDPSTAFGIYLIGALLLTIMSAATHFLGLVLLQERIRLSLP
ncbi:MAG TPA: Yip1 family protein [Methylomirabilota bacterium]|nr:Yip1 family protein [Methylomirabilota bacterium]